MRRRERGLYVCVCARKRERKRERETERERRYIHTFLKLNKLDRVGLDVDGEIGEVHQGVDQALHEDHHPDQLKMKTIDFSLNRFCQNISI